MLSPTVKHANYFDIRNTSPKQIVDSNPKKIQKEIKMKLKKVSLTALFGAFLLISSRGSTFAAVSAGTYQVITLGTAGSHAQEPGSKGTMTVSSRGIISGSLYSYEDRTTTRISGNLNLVTGVGTIYANGVSIKITATSKNATIIALSYAKTTSTSKGLVWGYK